MLLPAQCKGTWFVNFDKNEKRFCFIGLFNLNVLNGFSFQGKNNPKIELYLGRCCKYWGKWSTLCCVRQQQTEQKVVKKDEDASS